MWVCFHEQQNVLDRLIDGKCNKTHHIVYLATWNKMFLKSLSMKTKSYIQKINWTSVVSFPKGFGALEKWNIINFCLRDLSGPAICCLFSLVLLRSFRVGRWIFISISPIIPIFNILNGLSLIQWIILDPTRKLGKWNTLSDKIF